MKLRLPPVCLALLLWVPGIGLAGRQFPHECVLTDQRKQSIKVTLLARDGTHVTFRRASDSGTYRIPIARLAAKDRDLVKEFAVSPGKDPEEIRHELRRTERRRHGYVALRNRELERVESKLAVIAKRHRNEKMSASLRRAVGADELALKNKQSQLKAEIELYLNEEQALPR